MRELAHLVAEHGVAPARPIKAPSVQPTLRSVRELLEAWVAYRQAQPGLAWQTFRNSRSRARHVSQDLGTVRLDRLNLEAVERYRDGRLRGGAATATVHKELQALRMAWEWGRARGYSPDRDLPRVRVRVKPTRDRHTPCRADVLAVLDELDGWARLAVLLLYATGARIGEVSDLRWKDVDLALGEIRLSGKTGTRYVPVAPAVVSALREWGEAEPEATVLGVSTKVPRAQLSVRILAPACERAKVRRFTPHGLRRAAVDLMATAGVDIGTACTITGHSARVMLEHYRSATRADRRRAVEAAALGALPEGKVLPFRRTPNSAKLVQKAGTASPALPAQPATIEAIGGEVVPPTGLEPVAC